MRFPSLQPVVDLHRHAFSQASKPLAVSPCAQVFGTPGIAKPVGRCGFVQCGKNVTVGVIRPLPDPRDIERAYKRAVLADAHNANILRQYETFSLEYDKYGHGDSIKSCLICKGGQLCEVRRQRAIAQLSGAFPPSACSSRRSLYARSLGMLTEERLQGRA